MEKNEKCGCGQGHPPQHATCGATHAAETNSHDAALDEVGLEERLQHIRHKILVMSGKGGVGKSTVAANLAISLSLAGKRVGLLDVDIHGPSIPKMLHLEDAVVQTRDGAMLPVEQVTTPQDVATADVRRSINFCQQMDLPVLGVVENMSGFVCPKCGEVTDIFKSGGGERMAADTGVPFLGRIPIDPAVGQACDDGTPFVYRYSQTETAKAFERVIAPILALSSKIATHPEQNPTQEGKKAPMKIAIPTAEGKLCMHFGHCDQFALLDIDEKAKKITNKQTLTPPPHEPGVLPRWLHEQGATVIIAGGMGSRAQNLFAENSIQVMVGAPAEAPEQLVAQYLAGTLVSGANVCDH